MSPNLPRRALAASARQYTDSWALKNWLLVADESAELFLIRQKCVEYK
jgi:hypothetical protein